MAAKSNHTTSSEHRRAMIGRSLTSSSWFSTVVAMGKRVEARAERILVAIGAIQPIAAQDAQAVVGVAADVDHVRVPLDQPDRRTEPAPLEPVLVESLRGRGVGCRHHGHAAREEPAQQPGQDHRIANVGERRTRRSRAPGPRRRSGRPPLREGPTAPANSRRSRCTRCMNRWKCRRDLSANGSDWCETGP